MKKILLLQLYFLSCFFAFGQDRANNMSLHDSVRVKLNSDTVSFNHFQLLGRCKCADFIEKSDNYTIVYEELYALWTPFARILGKNKGMTKLDSYLNDYIENTITEENKFLDFHDDVVRYKHRTEIVCDRIFSDKKAWDAYQKLLQQENLFFGLDHHLREYLLPDSDVITNRGW